MRNKIYTWESEVKDSELDIQGVVNNSVYSVYLEHCRHKFLKAAGLNFVELHKNGLDLMARDCAIKFLYPLKSGDEFIVTTRVELTRKIKLTVHHEILRKPDHQKIVKAVYTIVGIDRNKGELKLPQQLVEYLEKKIK